MILLGLDKNGELQDAYQVSKGLNCGVVCPVCQTKLVAKQGKIKKWHFAHYRSSTSQHKACGESYLHISAKEIIRKSIGNYLILPASIQRWSRKPLGAVPLATNRFRIQSVDIEKHLSCINRRVDTWVSLLSAPPHQDIDVALEFNVHHAKDSDAIRDFEEANLFVAEVDLSYDRVLDISEKKGLSVVEALSSLILTHTDNKRWLSHRNYGRNLRCKHPDLIDCGKPKCLCPCSYCIEEEEQINESIEAQQGEVERLEKEKWLQDVKKQLTTADVIKEVVNGCIGKHLAFPSSVLGWSKALKGAKPFESEFSSQFLIKSVQFDKVLHTGKKADAFVSLGLKDTTGTEVGKTRVILQFGDLDKDLNVTASIKDFEEEKVSALHFKFDVDAIFSWMKKNPNRTLEGALRHYFLSYTGGKRWLYHREYGTPLACDHPHELRYSHGCRCSCKGCELIRRRHAQWKGRLGCIKCGQFIRKPDTLCYDCQFPEGSSLS